ncbi:MAG: hypothetical protein JWP01_1151 [Myxococcales bacterium]|nr:hypothetical protein [Myxococcales bacterium]
MVKQLGVLCAVLALGACTKTDDSFEREVAAHKVVEARHSGATTPTAVAPPGTLERRVLDLASCSLEGYQIAATCPAMRALTTELSSRGGSKELSLALGRTLLVHRSPAVRVEAAKLMGGDVASRRTIVETARRELLPGARQAFIEILATDGASVPAVATFLLESASHPDPQVRLQALAALTTGAHRSVPGAADTLIALVERDPDPTVRRTACALGGKLGSDALIPLYEKMTARTDDAELYTACMEGVVAMFHNAPSFDTASEAAYRLFLARLSAQPRTEHTPPWSVMSTFCYYSHGADLDKLAAWKARAPWFDAAAVKAVITSVIADRQASWMARSAAVESLVGLGASKDELAALKLGYNPKDAGDRPLLEKIDSALGQ